VIQHKETESWRRKRSRTLLDIVIKSLAGSAVSF
jgi:hypothetical protein